MIFDTDILVWVQRGNQKAAQLIEQTPEREISVQTYMELLQCAQNKAQQDYTKTFLKDFGFKVLPFTENIGHRASIYVEEHSLSQGLGAGDAVIAATAVENNMKLCSSNRKHFVGIENLSFYLFKP